VNPAKLNREMVNLEKLDQEDIDFLHQTITKHHNETGSTIAQDLLHEWPVHVHRLSKVMPADYRRVLDAQAKAISEGKDPLMAIMQASVGK
jgi:glutamate synthase (NADPH/NADH) large chain